jgi:hypothetical protein
MTPSAHELVLDLEPPVTAELDLSKFTKAQLVAFIVTAAEVRQARRNNARRGPERPNHRAS